MKTLRISMLLWLLPLLLFAADVKELHCPICGMHFKSTAKTQFGAAREGKPLTLCSFSCALRFHKKFPAEALTAQDFLSGQAVGAAHAFFLIRSQNILKELDFDMPPSVIAFAKEAEAQATRTRVKDGQVVEGFSKVEKAYE